MIARAEGHPAAAGQSIDALFGHLAEARDLRACLLVLRSALPWLLPETRVDIVMSTPAGIRLLLSCGDTDDQPPEPPPALTSFVGWLGDQGYALTSTLQLSAAGQHHGWLLLARRHLPLDLEQFGIASQLAALLAMRLCCERGREELAERDARLDELDQRLRELDEVRQRALLAAGAVHDIGNLLAAIMGHVQLLQPGAPASMQGDLQTILRAARDGHHLMRRMLAPRGQPQSTSVGAPIALLPTIVRDALKLAQPFLEARPEIVVRTTLAPVPAVSGHAAELREVIVNLVMNALAAMPAGGTLTLRCYSADEHAFVEVHDTGEGIARARQAAIFEPFVTTRESSSGLGLSVSRSIVESYGGRLTVESEAGQGATFRVMLPALRASDALQKPPPQQRAVS